jgi:bleomycin hydrolase
MGLDSLTHRRVDWATTEYTAPGISCALAGPSPRRWAMRKTIWAGALALLLVSSTVARAQSDRATYVPKYYDPVIEEMKDNADSLEAIADSITSAIRKRQKADSTLERENRKVLRFDVSGIVAPESPDVFESQFHFSPVAQYRTGTCWSFGTTSYLESEIARLSGRKIKLSEMYTVYHEYIEKARRFVRERGDEKIGQGSEANAVTRMMRQYGAVPEEVYSGLCTGVDRHDHSLLSGEIRDYLAYAKEHDYWDEDDVLGHVRVILNKYLGEPPTAFEFDGKTVTPSQFVDDVLGQSLSDYVGMISTTSIPFYTQGTFDVPDNWWHDSTYYNIPLGDYYAALSGAIKSGYTMVMAGDVSEPGWNGFADMSVIPDFDIPQSHINQDSRELRFYNHTTTDDHLIHLVGHTSLDGRDWFLIKDSGRSARWGQFEGYSFMRDDYVRLKMLGFMVHRDAVQDVLAKFKQASAGQ